MIEWQDNTPRPDIHIRAAALEKFLSRVPDREDIRLNLADQYMYLGDAKRAFDILSAARPDVRTEPDWLASYGKAARILGRDQIAKTCLTDAWQQGSNFAGVELSRLSADSGEHDQAIEICQSILAKDPSDYAAASNLCKNLIATDQLGLLWDWAQEYSQQQSGSALIPSAMAYASTEQAQIDMLQRLVAMESNIVCEHGVLGTTLGASLREILLAHKAGSNFPTIYAGKGEGKRIDRVLELGIAEINILFERIKEAVSQYGRQIDAKHPSHQYIGAPPTAASIESWANIFVGDGHEDWHCHPAGWISGVYYLDVPDLSDGGGADALANAGKIEFGPLKLGEHNDLPAWPKMQFRPEKDALLLFPSYFGHRTYPTQSRAPRMSIAFDVVPAGES